MATAIRTQETDTGLILSAEHSEIEFSIWQAGFKLWRGGKVVFQSGAGWGAPVSNISLWSMEENRVLLTFNRGTHGLGRLIVTAIDDGWRLAWDQPTRDTFHLETGGHWYGQGELIHQRWPLNTVSLWEAPLITWDNGPTGLGNIQEPLWITATGVALYVENATPTLLVGLNAPPSHIAPPSWSLSAAAPANTRPPAAMPGGSGVLSISDRRTPLSYLLLVGGDPVSAHQRALTVIGVPEGVPSESLLREPIWTTWAQYKMFIDQDNVLAFAEQIRAHGFPGSTLEIDDKWQQHYGDTAPDPARFPDPAGMVARLNAAGFAVTMWVVPFFAPESKNTQEGLRHNYMVRRGDGSHYEVTWWQGKGYLLDVSNPYALEWWAGKLRKLQQNLGLAGFKLDAGEANYLPPDASLFLPITRNEYSARWAQFGANHFPYGEVRCGWHSQRHAMLFRQWDKFSTWGLDNGLASVITTALSLGMAGYPFILPDMIGGNAYQEGTASKELLIRWVQVSAPMLAIQFSLAPWEYDAETVDLCRKYAHLHVDLLPVRLRAAQLATETGAPVIRPLFWAAPDDPVTLVIGDQYLLGDSHLVAPVVTPGATARDVYLPAGTWQDYWTGAIYEGGRWLREFSAPLDVLPLFVRV
jgi:alpha-glucosidase (family GH31 glycosyl hydrolase)